METTKKKQGAPPRYDEAFKSGAVRMVTEQGRPSAEVAKKLGICIDTLHRWFKGSGIQAGEAIYLKKVVGYAFPHSIDTNLTLIALNMAVHWQHPSEGLILHSDRGVLCAPQTTAIVEYE